MKSRRMWCWCLVVVLVGLLVGVGITQHAGAGGVPATFVTINLSGSTMERNDPSQWIDCIVVDATIKAKNPEPGWCYIRPQAKGYDDTS